MSFVVFAGAPHCSEENAQMQEETFDYDEESVLVQAEIHAVREQYGVNNFHNGATPGSSANDHRAIPGGIMGDDGVMSPGSVSNVGSGRAALAKIKPSKKKLDQDFVVDLLDAANTSSSEVITELRDINSIRFVDPSKWWPKFDGMTQRVSSQLLSNGGNGAAGG